RRAKWRATRFALQSDGSRSGPSVLASNRTAFHKLGFSTRTSHSPRHIKRHLAHDLANTVPDDHLGAARWRFSISIGTSPRPAGAARAPTFFGARRNGSAR